MRALKTLVILSLLTTACGTELPGTDSGAENASAGAAGDEGGGEAPYSYTIASRSDLPPCNRGHEQQLVYVVDEDQFVNCQGGAWVDVDISGPAGQDGSDGLDGANGQNGVAGVDGDDGEDARMLSVTNSNGDDLGRLYGVSASTNELFVALGDVRMQFTPANGVFPNAYLLYSGANCTGTLRVMIQNGQWANTFVDGRDASTIIKATGANLGSFAYSSRVAASNSCANTSGTALVSWATETPSLSFTYPIVGAQVVNDL